MILNAEAFGNWWHFLTGARIVGKNKFVRVYETIWSPKLVTILCNYESSLGDRNIFMGISISKYDVEHF